MKYIDVRWIHNDTEYPVRLVSEIGEDDFEKRKLEFFESGTVTFASECNQSGKTLLGDQEVPPLDEINENEEFEGKAIAPEDFEALWREYANKHM